jgi:hypothetical protein
MLSVSVNDILMRQHVKDHAFYTNESAAYVFANAFVMQSWSHNPYTLAQQLYGDYVVYSYASAKSDGQMFMASVNIGKTLDFMRGSANINGSFSSNESAGIIRIAE